MNLPPREWRAEYSFRGSLFDEHQIIHLTATDLDTAQDEAQFLAPEGAYAFCLFQIRPNDPDTDEQVRRLLHPDYNVMISGRRVNETGRFFLGGELRNTAEVEAMNDNGRYDILLSNMSGNGWDPVVFTRTGNVVPFEDGDTILTDRKTPHVAETGVDNL